MTNCDALIKEREELRVAKERELESMRRRLSKQDTVDFAKRMWRGEL